MKNAQKEYAKLVAAQLKERKRFFDKIAKVHTKRLLKLADILQKHKDKKKGGTLFDMGTFGSHSVDHMPTEKNFCGTRACALGHAALDPEFRAEGLKLQWNELHDGSEYHASVVLKGVYDIEGETGTDPQDEIAGAIFFGLSLDEANELFYNMAADKKEIVEQIRGLAKERAELTMGYPELEFYSAEVES